MIYRHFPPYPTYSSSVSVLSTILVTYNQYLTDYRIKMSKQFLSDPRYKIADISSKVGYSDGNYYSKTFKKIVGLSPSEYREKMLA